MAFKAFNLFYQMVPGHPLRPWGVGDSLRSGILPLLTLGAHRRDLSFRDASVSSRPAAWLTPHHGDDKDLAESRAAQGFRALIDRGTGGEHVVDQHRAVR